VGVLAPLLFCLTLLLRRQALEQHDAFLDRRLDDLTRSLDEYDS